MLNKGNFASISGVKYTVGAMRDIPKDILLKVLEGNTGAFEKLYRATADYVYTVAMKITGNRADAEEVTQDVLVKVHLNLRRFRFGSSFTTWLYRITVNNAISALRKSAKRRAREKQTLYAFSSPYAGNNIS